MLFIRGSICCVPSLVSSQDVLLTSGRSVTNRFLGSLDIYINTCLVANDSTRPSRSGLSVINRPDTSERSVGSKCSTASACITTDSSEKKNPPQWPCDLVSIEPFSWSETFKWVFRCCFRRIPARRTLTTTRGNSQFRGVGSLVSFQTITHRAGDFFRFFH